MKSTVTILVLLSIISSTVSRSAPSSSSPSVSWPREPPPESMMNEVYFMNSKEIDWEPSEMRAPKQKVILEKLSTLLTRLKKTNKQKFHDSYAGVKPIYPKISPKVSAKLKLTLKTDKPPKESEPIIRITITNLEPTGHSFSRRTYKYQ